MGGASRNEKKRRREEAAAQRLAAARITPPQRRGNRSSLIVVGAVVVVAVVVGLAVLLIRGSGERVAATYPVSASGGVITAGSASAPVGIDVYEDYLCPVCERFEERYGDELTTALNAGKITVRYHPVAILGNLTNPPDYSTRAANAALCAVPAGIFPGYHDKLFAEQPSEGSAGLSDDELVALGAELGATGDFAGCVASASNAEAVGAETVAAETDPALRSDRGFGTPTVAIDGRKIDVTDTAWLEDAIAAG